MNQSQERAINMLHVIRVARELFIEKGIANTRIREIAAAADLSEMSVYRYFQNKQNLINAVWDDALDFFYGKFKKSFQEHLTGEETGLDRFRICMDLYMKAYEDHPGWLPYTREMFAYAGTLRDNGDDPGTTEMFYKRLFNGIPPLMLNALKEGVKDGSIRPDVNVYGIYQMVCNLYTGTNIYRYFTEGIDDVDMFHYTAQMISDAIKTQ